MPRILLSRRLVSLLFAGFFPLVVVSAAQTELNVDDLLPLKPEVRQVLNQSCVMCHGEMIDGKAEIREDLDFSTDDAIRETLVDPLKLLEEISEDKMPHKGKLSFRLRSQPKMHERFDQIKSEFDKNGEKVVLMAWLNEAREKAKSRP